MDIPNDPRRKNAGMVNPAKYLVYEDVFIGGEEYGSQPDYPACYRRAAKDLASLAKRGGAYAYLFETSAKLCAMLAVKSTLSADLDRAYKNGDKKELAACLTKVKKTVKLTENFTAAIERQWRKESKPFGLEVMQIRMAGVIKRLRYAASELESYLAGHKDKIEELEEKKLHLKDPYISDENYGGTCFVSYLANVTYCKI